MAFHWKTFRTRALTAIVFVVVMMGGLLWNEWSFFFLFSLLHFGAWIEYGRLIEKFHRPYADRSLLHRAAVMTGGWCLLLFFTNYELHVGPVVLTELGLWAGIAIMILLPVVMWTESRPLFFTNIAFSLFGLIYISLPLSLMVELRTHPWENDNYPDLPLVLPLLVIFSIWINDTMAYIVGSLIGKTPLSSISPKKTWEGTVGGVILTVTVISLIAAATGKIPVIHAAVMSLLAAVSGTFGDLFESKLKRMAGVKDSGSFMPGHGGFLDRFDSLLFAAIAVWFYSWIVFA